MVYNLKASIYEITKIKSTKSKTLRNLKTNLKMTNNCKYCGEHFSTYTKLTKHTNMIHKYINLKPYKCEICNKQYLKNCYLRRHIKSSHEGEVFKCKICSLQYSQESSLWDHIQCVHKGKKYNCNICEKIFANRGSLRNHIKGIHNNELYQCKLCCYTAHRNGDLKKHDQKIHKTQLNIRK